MTKLFETTLATAFIPVRDAIRSEIEKRYRKDIEFTVEKYGFSYPRLNYSNPDRQTVSNAHSFMQPTKDGKEWPARGANGYTIREDYLAKKCDQYADDAVAGNIAKLVQKLGDLDNCELTFGGLGDFGLKGTKGDHKVVVEQQTVFKVSKNGQLFNQWPARIYVDGKFTSAADYADAVA